MRILGSSMKPSWAVLRRWTQHRSGRCRNLVASAVEAPASRPDRLLRSLSSNQEVAVLTVDGANLVAEAHHRHNLSPTASAALGRALLGSLLLGCFRKSEDSLQITFSGEGPLRGVQVIAESNGLVKGKVGNPSINLPLRKDGKLDVGAAVGPGTLSVVRTQPLSPVPYTGTVAITSGEIAEDLAVYLAESEQTNSALALSVQLAPGGAVSAAGGFFIQVLPFASDETLSQLEKNLSCLPAVSDLLAGGMPLETLTQAILEDIGVDETSFTEIQPRYGPCEKAALQDRMKSAVAALGEAEVAAIMEQEGKIEVTCHFCNECYQFAEDEIRERIAAPSRE